jgi:hypothetical protein
MCQLGSNEYNMACPNNCSLHKIEEMVLHNCKNRLLVGHSDQESNYKNIMATVTLLHIVLLEVVIGFW